MRIPTAADISGPGSLRSGRGVARQDTTARGRGLASFGQGVQSLGNSVTRVAQEEIQKQNTLDVARAEVTKTEGLLGVSNSFSQGGTNADAEYSTYGERARAASEAAVNEAAQLIRDPEMRERWKLTALNDALRTADGAADRGLALENQQQMVTFEETLDANQRLFTDPTLPREVQERARADIQASIEMAVATGLATPEQAAQWKTTYLDNADYTRAQLEVQRNPDAIYGTASATATAGAVTGVVSAGAGYTVVQLPDGTVERREGTRAWRNNNPGNIEFGPFAQSQGAVGSDGRFAVFPTYEAGREAKRALLFESGSYRDLSLSAAIARYAPAFENDTGSYTAQVAQAAGVSPDTPLSALSEDQQQAMLDAMERVEGFRPGRTSEQEGAGSTGAAPDWFTRLPPNQQAAIRQEAATARNAKSAETRARIEMAAQDAPVAIQNTGAYTGYQPSSADFLAAYGPIEAPQRYAQYQAAVETSQQAYGMRTMSADDITAMVTAARPTETGEGAALEQQRYDTLVGARNQIIEARNADPAAYVTTHMPRIGTQWQEAMASADPTQMQMAGRAILSAQTQLGILPENRRILSGPMLSEISRQFNLQGEGGQNAARTMQSMQQQWGALWPQVFSELADQLPAPALVAGAMSRPDQWQAAEELAEAVRVGADAYVKLLPTTDVTDLRRQVVSTVSEFSETVVRVPTGESTATAVQESVELLALRYASQGDSVSRAVERAYTNVIGKAYNFQDGYRIPTEIDAGAVAYGARTALEDIDLFNIDVPDSLFGLSEDQARDAFQSVIQSQGVWVTGPNEEGLVLYAPDGGAVTSGGQPITMTWSDLSSYASSRTETVEIDMASPEAGEAPQTVSVPVIVDLMNQPMDLMSADVSETRSAAQRMLLREDITEEQFLTVLDILNRREDQ